MGQIDLLIKNCKELLTLKNKGPKTGEALDRLDILTNSAVAVDQGRILETGPTHELEKRFQGPRRVIDARQKVVMPGFVDPHTHIAFNATREAEFDMRLRGKSYVEITRAGGGIFSSVNSLRQCETKELEKKIRERADAFMVLGTTTVEAKSGYGLNREDEIRVLEAIRKIDQEHPLDLVPTFLGAHEIPKEFKDNREQYISLLIDEILPEIKSKGLAEYCDIFTEAHVYGIEESRRIMGRAKELGFKLRFHADELEPMGGAELAAELGAASADHLVMCSDGGIEAMKDSNVTPVLLPATVFSLNLKTKPPARRMIQKGLPVALATDFNPGTSFTQSMPQVINIACCMLRLTVAEAINAATVNSAWSLDRGESLGSIEPGKQGDLLILDCDSHLYLGYQLGWNPVEMVIKKGKLVYQRPLQELSYIDKTHKQ